MADVQIAVIDQAEAVVNVAVPGVQGPIGLTGSVAIAQAGTAAEPGIRFESDTNTGIYSPGADQLAVSTGGVQRLLVTTGALSIGGPTGDTGLDIGLGATGNRSAYLDLIGDTTYTDYGLRIIRNGTGANATSAINQRGTGELSIQTSEAAPLTFFTANTERARIDSSGKLLVGTSTALGSVVGYVPSIQVLTADALTASISVTSTSNNAFSGSLVCTKSRAGAAVQANDGLGQFRFGGFDGSDYVESVRISVEVDGTPGADDMPGRLVFSTTADGAATSTERMRITSAGVLQIADAGNITVGTTTGTKIGTATTQKIGFYNTTPVVQPAAVADATDAVDVITQLNDLLAKLRTLGIIAT
jgi:hypothetical protein